jgi:hypothetical protein
MAIAAFAQLIFADFQIVKTQPPQFPYPQNEDRNQPNTEVQDKSPIKIDSDHDAPPSFRQ